MTSPSFDPLSSDIALHSPWMQRLAQSLVRDPSVAEDLVQDAWTKLGGQGARAGYLAAVVRSLSHRYHRGAQRRRGRERRGARAEALPSAAEVAERIEIVQRVTQALDELEEPYRTTLVLRYFDDLSAAEIARREGVPSSTVRARLRRGLERLRASLDDRHGGRANWVSMLLPLCRRPAEVSPALVATLSTVVAMKLVLGSLLCLCAIAVLWAYVAGDEEIEDPPLAVTETQAASALADVSKEPRGDEDSGTGARLALSQAASAMLLAAKPTEESGSGRVHVRALDAEQKPIQAAWLRLRQAPKSAAQADSDGRIELSVAPEELERLATLDSSRSIRIQIGGPGFRTHQVRAFLAEGRTSLELGEVLLYPGCIVNGRVVDESGLGVEGAMVTFGAPVEAQPGDARLARGGPADLNPNALGDTTPGLVTTSGPGGAFRLEGVAAGYGTVWARGAASLWAFSEPIGVRAGEEVSGIELVLHDAPDQIITGMVVDPDGRPLPGLELTFTTSAGSDGWNIRRTNVHGRFYFAPLDGAKQDIEAVSPVWEWEHLRRPAVPVGTLDLVLAFERSEWLELSVQDQDGKPVRNGRVVGLPGDGPTDRAVPRSKSPLDERGHARLRRPAGPLRVRVEAPGYRDALLGPFDPALFAAPLVVTLESVPALVGQVLLADGQPAAGARVGLHRGVSARSGSTAPGWKSSSQRSYLSHQGWAGDGEAFVYALHLAPEAQVTADEQGRFRLPLPGVDPRAEGEVQRVEQALFGLGYAGNKAQIVSGSSADQPWYVHAAADNSASITSGPHHLEATRDVQLDLRLPSGGAIAGRLALRNGASTAGWTARASDGLARIAETRVAEDGSFHFEHLHPGGWQVSVFPPGQRFSAQGGRLRTERVPQPVVEVVSGATVEYEHLSGVREDALLRGRLWLDGEPPGAWQVILRTMTEQAVISSYRGSLDPDGHFEFSLESGLRTTLGIHRPGRSGRLSVTTDLDIVPGQNTWSFDLETARIEGQIGASLSVKSRFGGPFYVVQEGRTIIRVALDVDEQGHFGPVLVPAGQGTLRGPRAGPRDEAPIWAELELEAGEVRRLDLR